MAALGKGRMRCAVALLAAFPAVSAVPASAQEFSLIGLLQSLTPATTDGWTATVVREADKPKDPFWTAVVHARKGEGVQVASLETEALGGGSRIETGAVQPHANARGPRVTGAPHEFDGIASYYWQEQMTASGEKFNKRDMTAAHKTLPLGTKVKVTNLNNGKSTIVRINDRGPFVPGRVIDVSEAAADVLGMRSAGLAPVRVDMIGP